MFAVFVAFVPEGDSSLKPIALGLAAGIAIDAFLVRMTLIPALMAILGERAWEIPAWLEKILPSVDIEGEAVERERHLAEWPGDDSVVAADDLSVTDAGISGLHLRLSPGGSAVLTGSSAGALRALALLIAGRATPDDGRLRVAGHLLPGRAAWVRAHVGAVLTADAGSLSADLSEALRGRPALVVIDAADRLSRPERDQLAARLRDSRSTTAILLTALDAEIALEILADAGRTPADVIDIDAPASQTRPESPVPRTVDGTTESTEVNA